MYFQLWHFPEFPNDMACSFCATIAVIGINPFVLVPDDILQKIFKDAQSDKGPIPVCGTVNGKKYLQTLVKYSGCWRLYINTTMLSHSPKRIGEEVAITIQFDSGDRTIQPHPKFLKALKKDEEARKVFDGLRPSLQKEMVRYISLLKSEESIQRNIVKAIGFLKGQNRFVGRDKP